jgi:hypothetical protein
MNETFSEADLEPSPADTGAKRRDLIDRAAGTVGAIAAGIVSGGMLALGACAAPAVFNLTPAPFSGTAMGEAFTRFDRVAIGAAVVALGAEVVRTFLARATRPRLGARIRRLTGIALAGCTAVLGLSLSPTINEMHAAGVRRGEGEQGVALEAVHKRAETVGKLEVALGFALVGLHLFTVRRAADEDEDVDAPAPLPPGPRSPEAAD